MQAQIKKPLKEPQMKLLDLKLKGEEMKISKGIRNVKVEDEFRKCLVCGYEFGFHTSFLKDKKDNAIE